MEQDTFTRLAEYAFELLTSIYPVTPGPLGSEQDSQDADIEQFRTQTWQQLKRPTSPQRPSSVPPFSVRPSDIPSAPLSPSPEHVGTDAVPQPLATTNLESSQDSPSLDRDLAQTLHPHPESLDVSRSFIASPDQLPGEHLTTETPIPGQSEQAPVLVSQPSKAELSSKPWQPTDPEAGDPDAFFLAPKELKESKMGLAFNHATRPSPHLTDSTHSPSVVDQAGPQPLSDLPPSDLDSQTEQIQAGPPVQPSAPHIPDAQCVTRAAAAPAAELKDQIEFAINEPIQASDSTSPSLTVLEEQHTPSQPPVSSTGEIDTQKKEIHPPNQGNAPIETTRSRLKNQLSTPQTEPNQSPKAENRRPSSAAEPSQSVTQPSESDVHLSGSLIQASNPGTSSPAGQERELGNLPTDGLLPPQVSPFQDDAPTKDELTAQEEERPSVGHSPDGQIFPAAEDVATKHAHQAQTSNQTQENQPDASPASIPSASEPDTSPLKSIITAHGAERSLDPATSSSKVLEIADPLRSSLTPSAPVTLSNDSAASTLDPQVNLGQSAQLKHPQLPSNVAPGHAVIEPTEQDDSIARPTDQTIAPPQAIFPAPQQQPPPNPPVKQQSPSQMPPFQHAIRTKDELKTEDITTPSTINSSDSNTPIAVDEVANPTPQFFDISEEDQPDSLLADNTSTTADSSPIPTSTANEIENPLEPAVPNSASMDASAPLSSPLTSPKQIALSHGIATSIPSSQADLSTSPQTEHLHPSHQLEPQEIVTEPNPLEVPVVRTPSQTSPSFQASPPIIGSQPGQKQLPHDSRVDARSPSKTTPIQEEVKTKDVLPSKRVVPPVGEDTLDRQSLSATDDASGHFSSQEGLLHHNSDSPPDSPRGSILDRVLLFFATEHQNAERKRRERHHAQQVQPSDPSQDRPSSPAPVPTASAEDVLTPTAAPSTTHEFESPSDPTTPTPKFPEDTDPLSSSVTPPTPIAQSNDGAASSFVPQADLSQSPQPQNPHPANRIQPPQDVLGQSQPGDHIVYSPSQARSSTPAATLAKTFPSKPDQSPRNRPVDPKSPPGVSPFQNEEPSKDKLPPADVVMPSVEHAPNEQTLPTVDDVNPVQPSLPSDTAQNKQLGALFPGAVSATDSYQPTATTAPQPLESQSGPNQNAPSGPPPLQDEVRTKDNLATEGGVTPSVRSSLDRQSFPATADSDLSASQDRVLFPNHDPLNDSARSRILDKRPQFVTTEHQEVERKHQHPQPPQNPRPLDIDQDGQPGVYPPSALPARQKPPSPAPESTSVNEVESPDNPSTLQSDSLDVAAPLSSPLASTDSIDQRNDDTGGAPQPPQAKLNLSPQPVRRHLSSRVESIHIEPTGHDDAIAHAASLESAPSQVSNPPTDERFLPGTLPLQGTVQAQEDFKTEGGFTLAVEHSPNGQIFPADHDGVIKHAQSAQPSHTVRSNSSGSASSLIPPEIAPTVPLPSANTTTSSGVSPPPAIPTVHEVEHSSDPKTQRSASLKNSEPLSLSSASASPLVPSNNNTVVPFEPPQPEEHRHPLSRVPPPQPVPSPADQNAPITRSSSQTSSLSWANNLAISPQPEQQRSQRWLPLDRSASSGELPLQDDLQTMDTLPSKAGVKSSDQHAADQGFLPTIDDVIRNTQQGHPIAIDQGSQPGVTSPSIPPASASTALLLTAIVTNHELDRPSQSIVPMSVPLEAPTPASRLALPHDSAAVPHAPGFPFSQSDPLKAHPSPSRVEQQQPISDRVDPAVPLTRAQPQANSPSIFSPTGQVKFPSHPLPDQRSSSGGQPFQHHEVRTTDNPTTESVMPSPTKHVSFGQPLPVDDSSVQQHTQPVQSSDSAQVRQSGSGSPSIPSASATDLPPLAHTPTKVESPLEPVAPNSMFFEVSSPLRSSVASASPISFSNDRPVSTSAPLQLRSSPSQHQSPTARPISVHPPEPPTGTDLSLTPFPPPALQQGAQGHKPGEQTSTKQDQTALTTAHHSSNLKEHSSAASSSPVSSVEATQQQHLARMSRSQRHESQAIDTSLGHSSLVRVRQSEPSSALASGADATGSMAPSGSLVADDLPSSTEHSSAMVQSRPRNESHIQTQKAGLNSAPLRSQPLSVAPRVVPDASQGVRSPSVHSRAVSVPQQVRVNIGRIKITAPPPKPQRPRFQRPGPSLSLDQYLQQRQGRRG